MPRPARQLAGWSMCKDLRCRFTSGGHHGGELQIPRSTRDDKLKRNDEEPRNRWQCVELTKLEGSHSAALEIPVSKQRGGLVGSVERSLQFAPCFQTEMDHVQADREVHEK